MNMPQAANNPNIYLPRGEQINELKYIQLFSNKKIQITDLNNDMNKSQTHDAK